MKCRLAANLVAVALSLMAASPAAWSNGGHSTSMNIPKFGTHDYIAFKGYAMAGTPSFIKQNCIYRLSDWDAHSRTKRASVSRARAAGSAAPAR